MGRIRKTGLFKTWIPRTAGEVYKSLETGALPRGSSRIVECLLNALTVLDREVARARRKRLPIFFSSRDVHRRLQCVTVSREDLNRKLEQYSPSNLLSNHRKRDAYSLLWAEYLFQSSFKPLKDFLKTVERLPTFKAHQHTPADLLEMCISIAMQIAALDQKLALRHLEPTVIAGTNWLKWQRGSAKTLRQTKKDREAEFLIFYARARGKSSRQKILNARDTQKTEGQHDPPCIAAAYVLLKEMQKPSAKIVSKSPILET